MQKLKNNESRPKFIGSYKKKSVYHRGHSWLLSFSYSLSMILRQISILKFAFLQTIVSYTELSPPASVFPAASNYFFICYIPHENKVVVNCKLKKKTRFAGCSGYRVVSVSVFTDSGPSCMAVRCSCDSISQT